MQSKQYPDTGLTQNLISNFFGGVEKKGGEGEEGVGSEGGRGWCAGATRASFRGFSVRITAADCSQSMNKVTTRP